MNNNHVPWAKDDRERCEYCGFFVRSPVFYFPPGTYKFVIANMQYEMYVRALTATGNVLLDYLDFGGSLDKYKRTATLVVETGDFYRFTASTTVSATPPGLASRCGSSPATPRRGSMSLRRDGTSPT